MSLRGRGRVRVRVRRERGLRRANLCRSRTAIENGTLVTIRPQLSRVCVGVVVEEDRTKQREVVLLCVVVTVCVMMWVSG